MEMCSFVASDNSCAYTLYKFMQHATVVCKRECVFVCVSFLCHPSVPGELRMPLKDAKTAAISVTGSDHWDPQRLTTHMHVCDADFHSLWRGHTHIHTLTQRHTGNHYTIPLIALKWTVSYFVYVREYIRVQWGLFCFFPGWTSGSEIYSSCTENPKIFTLKW